MYQSINTAQKGTENNTRGSKHKLLLDRAVHQDSDTRQTNLMTAWIHYKKHYNSMPHKKLLECLILHKDNSVLMAFIKNSTVLLKATVVDSTVSLFEGNSSSDHQLVNIPSWSSIDLYPLSKLITKSGYGNRFRRGVTFSNLLYMNDIKLYARSEQDIDSLIHLTGIYMPTVLDKLGLLVAKRGKVTEVELPEGRYTGPL